MGKYIWELNNIPTLNDDDCILVVVGTSEYLIKKSDFVKVAGGLSNVQLEKISKIIVDGDGTRFLNNAGEYVDISEILSSKQFFKNDSGLIEITDYHNHSNINILNKFTIDTETGALLYDGESISGEDTYVLPTASATVLGGVKIDNDTIKINNGIISADVIGNWSAGVSYPVGYFVVYEETLYECITANNDSEWIEGNWLLIGGKNTGMSINNWTANTEYTVGNLVINETTIYQCHTEHTSGEAFDSTNWTAMTGAKGDKGDDGFSPIVKIESTDTGVTITVTDATETTTADISNGTDGITPHIDEASKRWMVGEEDTGIVAEGKDGVSPHIDETTKHWFIGEEDTGIIAEATSTVVTNAVVYTGVLIAEDWIGETVPYTQQVVVNGLTAASRPYLYVSYSADDSDTILEEQKQWGYITRAVTSDNLVTFYCYKNKPTIALNFEAEVR